MGQSENHIFESDDEGLLQKWEQVGRSKFGLPRIYFRILVGVACILAIVTIFFVLGWCFSGSSDSRSTINQSVKRDATEGLSQTQQMTTTHITFDEFGNMQSETATETTGFDKNGNRVATRETKQGDAANAEAEQMVGELGPMIGLIGHAQPDHAAAAPRPHGRIHGANDCRSYDGRRGTS